MGLSPQTRETVVAPAATGVLDPRTGMFVAYRDTRLETRPR